MEEQLKKLENLVGLWLKGLNLYFIEFGLFQEEQIKFFQAEIQNMKQNKPDEENEELMKLVTENSKLKLRLSILNKVNLF